MDWNLESPFCTSFSLILDCRMASSPPPDDRMNELSVAELRVKSRRIYLEARKEKGVQELEEELRDEDFLFKGVKLTNVKKKKSNSKNLH